MKPLYARKETDHGVRKVMLDMAFIVTNKKIRLPKYQMEEGLFLPYYPEKKDKSRTEKLFLKPDNANKQDEHFYYYDFNFKPEQVEELAS